MEQLEFSPAKNIVRIGLFILTVFFASTAGFMWAGWSFEDSIYMVAITVFTVG